jgi:hypothetical protein
VQKLVKQDKVIKIFKVKDYMKKPMKKAAGKKMSEYGGMEMYGSKKAMMKKVAKKKK